MNLMGIRLAAIVVLVYLVFPATAYAAPATDGGANNGFDLILIGLAVMLLVGKLGGELFERLGQPAVLGELIGGILIGNLILFGVTAAEPLKTDAIIAAMAEIGVIILLFEVGLESDIHEMLEVGWSSLIVAVLGVVAPFLLGWAASAYFLPDASRLVHLFIGATLCATSVGITARVFKDLAKLNTREARIILGAAVIDDVIGLLILAVVVGAIKAAATGTVVSLIDIGWIAAKAIGFLLVSIVLGQLLVPRLLRSAGRLETKGVLLTLAISFCFFLSWAAARAGLAPIVGAFAAGLVLDEVHYTAPRGRKERNLEELLQPVSTFVVPVFFVLMGLKVDLRTFARIDIIWFALTLTIVAIIGKQICSLGVVERGLNRIAVGIGMIPRGEVGLIFAGIGSALMLPNPSGGTTPVINQATFSAVVIMVILTTLITPPALKLSMGSRRRGSITVED
jgi:Kef-type K+ transport system membrane component KefB